MSEENLYFIKEDMLYALQTLINKYGYDNYMSLQEAIEKLEVEVKVLEKEYEAEQQKFLEYLEEQRKNNPVVEKRRRTFF